MMGSWTAMTCQSYQPQRLAERFRGGIWWSLGMKETMEQRFIRKKRSQWRISPAWYISLWVSRNQWIGDSRQPQPASFYKRIRCLIHILGGMVWLCINRLSEAEWIVLDNFCCNQKGARNNCSSWYAVKFFSRVQDMLFENWFINKGTLIFILCKSWERNDVF